MRALRQAVMALATLAFSLPASAQPVDDLQVADATVLSIGWKLAAANASLCARAAPSLGLLLLDARTFVDPATARTTYGLSGDIGVAAVAAGSPAERAGLAANMTVTALGDEPVTALPLPATGSWERQYALQTKLEDLAARNGRITLDIAGKGPVTLAGQPACFVRFMLDDGKGNARATRRRVRIGHRLYNQVQRLPDAEREPVLAAVIAHELGHAVLDHQSRIEKKERSGETRRTEREADRVSVWLLANAGYDPQAALLMMRKIVGAGEFLFAMPSHGGWKGRARDIAAEITAMEAARAADPAHLANWPKDFRPQP